MQMNRSGFDLVFLDLLLRRDLTTAEKSTWPFSAITTQEGITITSPTANWLVCHGVSLQASQTWQGPDDWTVR
jgi:hypothetical protein